MDEYESPSHTKWDCKYHVIFIPKYRRKRLHGELRKYSGDVFKHIVIEHLFRDMAGNIHGLVASATLRQLRDSISHKKQQRALWWL